MGGLSHCLLLSRSPFSVCVFSCCRSWNGLARQSMPCSVLGPFPSSNSRDFPPIKCSQVWRGSDLHLGIQTAALLGGEKQFSVPSAIGRRIRAALCPDLQPFWPGGELLRVICLLLYVITAFESRAGALSVCLGSPIFLLIFLNSTNEQITVQQ